MKQRLLVIGAQNKSLGHAVAKMWSDMYDADVLTAGITKDEQVNLVVDDAEELGSLFQKFKPTRVVCTIGINQELGDNDFEFWMNEHLRVNCYLPMHVLMTWLDQEGKAAPDTGAHFVAISSNSAHIPRSKSMAYNASKAALSMAVRCAARDLSKAGYPMSVYGYEPGLIKGTPMSGERGGTRMLGEGVAQGINRRALASQIVHNLAFGGPELNGVLMRIDAGEV